MTKDNIDIFTEIKKDFFLFRNGIIADAIRKLYPPGTTIYGLNVPQFMELSLRYPHDNELAARLWQDKNCRESRLMALYLFKPELISREQAVKMIDSLESSETAEFLAFKVLRRLPFALELYKDISQNYSQNSFSRYGLEMLLKNIKSM